MRPLRHQGHDPALSRHERQADTRESEERKGEASRGILRVPEQKLLPKVQQLVGLRHHDRPEEAAEQRGTEHVAPPVPRRGGGETADTRHNSGGSTEEARANDADARQPARRKTATADKGKLPALLRRHDGTDKRHLRQRSEAYPAGRETRVRHVRPDIQTARGRKVAGALRPKRPKPSFGRERGRDAALYAYRKVCAAYGTGRPHGGRRKGAAKSIRLQRPTGGARY